MDMPGRCVMDEKTRCRAQSPTLAFFTHDCIQFLSTHLRSRTFRSIHTASVSFSPHYPSPSFRLSHELLTSPSLPTHRHDNLPEPTQGTFCASLCFCICHCQCSHRSILLLLHSPASAILFDMIFASKFLILTVLSLSSATSYV